MEMIRILTKSLSFVKFEDQKLRLGVISEEKKLQREDEQEQEQEQEQGRLHT